MLSKLCYFKNSETQELSCSLLKLLFHTNHISSLNNIFYQLFTSFTTEKAWFCNTKSEVLHGIAKIQQKMRRQFVHCWSSRVMTVSSIGDPFSILLLMGPVCSCSVVSIHFIVLSDCLPCLHPKPFHCLWFFMCCFHYNICFCSSTACYNGYHLWMYS